MDTVAKSANNFYEKNSDFLKNHSDFHSKNLTHFKEARDAYIQQAKDAIAFLKVPPCCRLRACCDFIVYACSIIPLFILQVPRFTCVLDVPE